MPELPEVETIRRQLDQSLKGLKVTGIQILSKKNFIGLPGAVIGRKVEDVQRRAKIILIKLDGDKCLAIHLKLTGQLIYRCLGEKCLIILEKEEGPFSVKELPNKFTRIIIEFDKGKLYFNDLRKFGWIKVVDLKKGECDLPELKKLGPEAIEGKAFTRQYFQEVLLKSKKPIKLVILDQEKLAGVGNIYANEALFGAGISPTRPANSLKPVEADRLRETLLRFCGKQSLTKGLQMKMRLIVKPPEKKAVSKIF